VFLRWIRVLGTFEGRRQTDAGSFRYSFWCGGSGTRLWPLSREAFPKQFHKLTGAETLFQQTCRRFTGDLFGDLFVLSNHRHRFLIAEQLKAAGLPATNIVKPHRLANPGKIPAFLIEVQSGSYLDESDIVRLDDIYPPRLAQIARPTRGPSRSRPGGAPPPDRKKDQLSAGAGAAAPVQARAPEAEVAAGMKRIRPTMTAITSI
jgi:hypothetical protein